MSIKELIDKIINLNYKNLFLKTRNIFLKIINYNFLTKKNFIYITLIIIFNILFFSNAIVYIGFIIMYTFDFIIKSFGSLFNIVPSNPEIIETNFLLGIIFYIDFLLIIGNLYLFYKLGVIKKYINGKKIFILLIISLLFFLIYSIFITFNNKSDYNIKEKGSPSVILEEKVKCVSDNNLRIYFKYSPFYYTINIEKNDKNSIETYFAGDDNACKFVDFDKNGIVWYYNDSWRYYSTRIDGKTTFKSIDWKPDFE